MITMADNTKIMEIYTYCSSCKKEYENEEPKCNCKLEWKLFGISIILIPIIIFSLLLIGVF